MSGFKMFKKVVRHLFRRATTRLYPYQGARVPDGFRGMLCHRADKCIYCGLCQRVCPTGAISVEVNKKWSYDAELCIFCGACEEVCREAVKAGAISLTKEFSMVHSKPSDFPKVEHAKEVKTRGRERG